MPRLLPALLVASAVAVPQVAVSLPGTPAPAAVTAAPVSDITATDVVNGQAVGALAGQGAVTADGAGRYSVPLWVPPGRAGIQPDLSLEYDSRAGDGPLGVGWTLSGLSTISRCERTFAQDGAARGITFTDGDSGDRYCLDGQRLVVTGGPAGPDSAYGDDGTEYRTERDSHVKVVSHGRDGQGPGYFTAYLPDGRILTFGGADSPGSRLEGKRDQVEYSAVGPTPDSNTWTVGHSQVVRLAWALSSAEDRAGNSLSVKYTLTESPDFGYEQLPETIAYTGSTRDPAVTASRRIRFRYEDRKDSGTRYVAGLRLEQSKRLAYVDASWQPPGSQSRLVSEYRLGYRNNTESGRSLLSRLEECDGAGVCLPPTAFDWSPGPGNVFSDLDTGIPVTLTAAGGVDQSPIVQVGDVDGDGRDDILYRDNSPGGGTQAGCTVPAPAGSVGCRHLPVECAGPQPDGRVIDMNGDSQADLVFLERESCDQTKPARYLNRIVTDLATGARSVRDPVEDFESYNKASYQVDLDGDGLPESVSADFSAYRENSTAGLGQYLATGAVPSFSDAAKGLAADIDGSGRASLLLPGACAGGCWTALSLDSGKPALTPLTALVGRPGKYGQPIFMDVNGDHLDDWVSQGPDRGYLNVSINTGNGFLAPQRWTVPAPYDRSPSVDPLYTSSNPSTANPATDIGARVIDYNGDGRQDLLLMGGAPSPVAPLNTVAVLLSTGKGFTGLSLPPNVPVGASLNAPAQSMPNDFVGYRMSRTLDANGDGVADLVQVVNGHFHVYVRSTCSSGGANPQCQRGDLLTTVTDGAGVTESFAYKSASEPGAHRPGTDCRYPQTCVAAGVWVVVRHQVSAPGTPVHTDVGYRYEDARADMTGRGWLGFGAQVATDAVRGSVTTTTYDNRTRVAGFYACDGLPRTLAQDVELSSKRVRRTTESMQCAVVRGAGDRTYFPYSGDSELRESEGSPGAPALLRLVRSHLVEDDFGNPTASDVQAYQVRDGAAAGRPERLQTTWDVDNFAGSWLIGQVARERETSTTPDGHAATRTTAYGYDADTGLLTSLAVEPDSQGLHDDLFQEVTATRDEYGLVRSVTASDGGADPDRTDQVEYDNADHMFPTVVHDAAGHETRLRYTAGLGLLAEQTDANGLITRYQYDGFGRVRALDQPDSDDTTVHYLSAGGLPQVTTAENGGQTVTVTLDPFGDEVAQAWADFAGQPVTTEAAYDELGRVTSVSYPHGAADPARLESYRYDPLDRPLAVVHPDGTSSTAEYDGLKVTLRDEQGNRTDLLQDEAGRTASAAEFLGSRPLVTSYAYGPFDELATVTAPDAAVTRFTYDRLGQLTAVTDADAGPRTVRYDGFGEVREETDGRQQTQAYRYDALGRIVSVRAPAGTTTYTWDTAAHGIGQLASAVSADGVTTGYHYDTSARPDRATTTVGGKAYAFATAYDAYSRVDTLTYPADPGQAPLRVKYSYTSRGDLQDVKNAATGLAYWTALSRNALGQPTADELGNGVKVTRQYDARNRLTRVTAARGTAAPVQDLEYAYQANGNVADRKDHGLGVDDQFSYDSLDRLTGWTRITGAHQVATVIGYSDGGNILTMTKSGGTPASTRYTYGEHGAGPHAVTTVTAGSRVTHYGYDAAGDQSSGPGGTVSYTSFGLPSQVRAAGGNIQYGYDANQERAYRKGPGGSSTVYVGGLYEQRTQAGHTDNVSYIPSGDGPVAQVTAGSVAYLNTDLLGSVTSMSGAAGQLTGRYDYDPFGARRAVPGGTAGNQVTLGFTGAQHDAATGLIDLHGRLYDPATGRFTSPDPLLQADGQAANPYSYVLNNPETLRDPTGLEGESDEEGDGPGWTTKTGPASGDCEGECEFSEGLTIEHGCPGICGGGTTATGTPVADDSGRTVTGTHEVVSEQEMREELAGAPLSITGVRFGNPDRPRSSYLNPKAADYAGAGYVKFAEWVEAGWGCFACHSTHSTGQIPTDSQIDLDRSRKTTLAMGFFRSLLETTLSLGQRLASAPSASRQQKAQAAIDFMEKEVEKANGKQAVNMRTLGAMVARDAEGNEVVVVASGKRDVSEAVQAVAEAEGYQVARLPGADAEETLGLHADQNKLTPLLMKTNQISCDVCSLVMPESGGVLQPDKATWEWPAGSWEP